MAAKDDLGAHGEDLAAHFLQQRGYAIVQRNWRCRQGEIDLIARHGGVTVFVEVKTRSSVAYGGPLEAVTPAKAARLRRLAGAWCESQGPLEGTIRIDVIGILAPAGREPVIHHVPGAC